MTHAAEIHDLIEEIVTHWGLELEVTATPAADTVLVNLDGPDAGYLGDGDGRVLEALQYLISKMSSRLLKDNVRVLLDAGGFRDRRDAELRQQALDLAARAREDGRKIRLEPLNPYERRVVHLTLKEDPNVRTFSVGRGYLKRVTIEPLPQGDDQPTGSAEEEADAEVRSESAPRRRGRASRHAARTPAGAASLDDANAEDEGAAAAERPAGSRRGRVSEDADDLEDAEGHETDSGDVDDDDLGEDIDDEAADDEAGSEQDDDEEADDDESGDEPPGDRRY